MTTQQTQTMFDLATWLGRRQAFRLINHKCSAAEAECLKKIKEQAPHKEMNLTWEDFCSLRLGVSRSYADLMIQRFTEFGESYFQLAEIMQISAPEYRQIAAAVNGRYIEYKDEKILISP